MTMHATSELKLTHPGRVVDQSTGLTKRDLVEHYQHVAPYMLPHVKGRPVALLRAPSGLHGNLFFQKHAGALRIPELKRLDPSLDPGHPPLLQIDSATALVGAAQMNVVEFHTWNACSHRIEHPDRLTFDLDPGEGVTWQAMRDAASLLRALLEEIGLRSLLKTSGGKGLHVVVPIAPRHEWEMARRFSQAVTRHLAHLAPDRFAARSGPKNRVGRIFPDYLRNGRGATTVAAYSARARPGLGVSVPVGWDELQELEGGAHWTVTNLHERLRPGEDAWAGMGSLRQSLTRPMRLLDRLMS